KLLRTGEALDARGKVRVRGAALQDRPEHRHDPVEPDAVERREHAARLRDLEYGDAAAGHEHPPKLAQAAVEVGDVADAEADGRRLDRAVAERKREHAPLDPDRGGKLAARTLEHPRREVETGDDAPGTCARDSEVAGATARVQDTIAGPHDRLGRDPA